ncbi:TatD family hydrolase [Salibacterium halotolerans]|uniref:TatD family hydrolase n=1 Tax=Salibacterium halotolerans TaxID=1884432 RepID=UPI001FCD7089|nr:TatD family hydrolase [Salibacterium halotolerans]
MLPEEVYPFCLGEKHSGERFAADSRGNTEYKKKREAGAVFDAHIHLEQYDNLDERIKRWHEAGVEQVTAVSNDLASSYRTLEIKERHPDVVRAGCGFHPEQPLPETSEREEWKHLVKLEREHIACIGEIGLPHYELGHLPSPLEAYQEFLAECLLLARDLKLPAALHAVHDKAELAFDILRREAPAVPAHFHWLKAPEDVAARITKAGYMVSVTPEVCYRERDQRLAAAVPPDQLLIETDGPWPFQGPFAGIETTPELLRDVITTLAGITGEKKADLAARTQKNAERMYGGR